MKYSFIITYYNREVLFHNTLLSYQHFYKDRHDVEFLVLEDFKTVKDLEEHVKLVQLLNVFSDDLKIVHKEMSNINFNCPCGTINKGVDAASGEYVILANPENMLLCDLLTGFDEEIAKDIDTYIVPACLHLEGALHSKLNKYTDYKWNGNGKWINHTVKKPAGKDLNHCTCISKKNYQAMGGFDEKWDTSLQGSADVEFIGRLKKMYRVVNRDDLVVAHITHPQAYKTAKFVSDRELFLKGELG